MNNFSETINESTPKRLSNLFELVGDPKQDHRTALSKEFLAAVDERQEKINLSSKDAIAAVKLFKAGRFEDALREIWGSKLEIDEENKEGGTVTVRKYTVKGYGEFVEMQSWTANSIYHHSITAAYACDPQPSYSLAHIIDLTVKKTSPLFTVQCEKADADAFKGTSTAQILNILFVCFDRKDIMYALLNTHLKLKNKLQ
jgi:hypothetical protein